MILQAWSSNLHKQICAQLNLHNSYNKEHSINTTIHVQLSKNELNSFKTEYCNHISHQSNPQYHNIHNSVQYPYYYSCQYYHSHKDQRRPPCRMVDGKMEYNYNEHYISDGFSPTTCSNWIQYIYHPKVYKTKQCQNALCRRRYCPKLHTGEQIQVIEPKQQVKAKENKVFAHINQIKHLKEISSIQQCNSPLLKQQMKKIQITINNYVKNLNKYEAEEQNKLIDLKNQIRTLAINATNQGDLKGKNVPKHMEVQDDFDVLFFNEQLKIVQDRQHEFKMFKDKDPRKIAALVLEYISAFLNSDGGSIYLGINDESIVHGLEVSQKWLDQFKLAIDSDGRHHINPPLIPQKYDLRIIPVKHHKKIDLKVIQIKVFPQSQQEKKILTLYKKECYLRMNASNHRLAASDIMEYMRLVGSKKALEALEKSEQEIQRMNLNQLKQLQEQINKMNSKISTTLRKRQKQQQAVPQNQS